EAVLLADPDYDVLGEPEADAPGSPEKRFRSLPGIAREADAVTQLLRGQPDWQVQSLRRERASEEALTKAARPRLLYLLTHGFFLRDQQVLDDGGGWLRKLELAGPAPFGNLAADPRLRNGLALAGANRSHERSAKG